MPSAYLLDRQSLDWFYAFSSSADTWTDLSNIFETPLWWLWKGLKYLGPLRVKERRQHCPELDLPKRSSREAQGKPANTHTNKRSSRKTQGKPAWKQTHTNEAQGKHKGNLHWGTQKHEILVMFVSSAVQIFYVNYSKYLQKYVVKISNIQSPIL